MAHCRLLLRELHARGLNAEQRLAALGIRYTEAQDLQHFLSASQFEAFLRMVVELSEDPSIGLHAGSRVTLQDLNLLGLLMMASPDVETALTHYRRHRGAVTGCHDAELFVDEHVLIYRRVMPGVRPSRVLSEYCVARAIALSRLMVGDVEPLEVRMMHPPPSDLTLHRRLLGAHLRFLASEDAVIFPATILQRPLRHGDPVTMAVLVRHFENLPSGQEPLGSDLIAHVRLAILTALPNGRATMTEVADHLKLSERTLRRQLDQLGTSYQKLLDEVRREEATRQLRDLRQPLRDLSVRLGFANRAAFYRAFRRWTGMSPAQYRAQLM